MQSDTFFHHAVRVVGDRDTRLLRRNGHKPQWSLFQA